MNGKHDEDVGESAFEPLAVIADRPVKDGQRRVVIGHSGMVEVARMDYFPDGKSEGYLRLLLSAPELLHALEECVAWMDAPHRATPLQAAILKEARAAIAKVEGGSQ